MQKDIPFSLDQQLTRVRALVASCPDSEAFPEAAVAYVENGGALETIQELSRETNWRFAEPERRFVVFINRKELGEDYQRTLDEIADRVGRPKTTMECLKRMRLITSLMDQWRVSRTFLLPTDPRPDVLDDLSAMMSGSKSASASPNRVDLQSSAASVNGAHKSWL